MAYFLFIDESGQDHRDSPYEVLAGVAIEDRDLWNMIQAVQAAEIRHFGIRYSAGPNELKAKKILKRKVFRMAAQMPPFPDEERRTLAKRCLEDGGSAGRRELTALAQAKLAYVREVFEICARFRCRVFATVVTEPTSCNHTTDYLRKDYSYLFERFFYFLEDVDTSASGIIVFDELEKSKSHILLNQMDRYFKLTEKGRQRSGRIIPEPFFVHSDLTTGIQIADLVAYIILWGFRTKEMVAPVREELADYERFVRQLRYRTSREIKDNPEFIIWSICVIRGFSAKDSTDELE